MGVGRKISQSAQPLYHTDFHAWSEEQARAIRQGRFDDLDIENVAEEIESLGKTERRELQSRLEVILLHLLKWAYQSKKRSRSWRNSIDQQRARVAILLRKNPSIKANFSEELSDAYDLARQSAGNEMGLQPKEWQRKFPAKCPWSASQILEDSFLPDSPTT